jgi:RNase P/RNase MRP subunit POP5
VNILIARRKSRYILVEASRDVEMETKEAQIGLSEGIGKIIGEFGYMNASPKVMRQISPSAFIIRVSRSTEGGVAMALAFVKELNGKQIGFYTIKTSGSMKKLIDLSKAIYRG